MKKYLFLLAAACMALTTFTSCGEDGDDTDMAITKEFFYGTWKCNQERTYDIATGNTINEQAANYTVIFYADGTMNYFGLSDFQWTFDSETGTIYITSPTTMTYHVDIVNENQINLWFENTVDGSSVHRTVLYFHKVLENM